MKRRRVFNGAPRSRQRSALSLIEMMVVIATSSLIFGIAITFIITLMHRDQRTRSFGVETARLTELAAVIRADIRQATKVALDGTKLVISLRDGSQRVYAIDDYGCRQIVEEVDGVAQSVDHFTIVGTSRWRLEQLPSGNHLLFAVTLERSKVDAQKTLLPPLVIYGALGIDSPPRPDGA